MTDAAPSGIRAQLAQALDVIQRHLAPTLISVHLYGSAMDGGLKPLSDIDLLVTVNARLDDAARQALMTDLLAVSAPPSESDVLRALEVTVLVRDDVVPWRYPARRELQFGEWLRRDLLAGIVEPGGIDADLAILLTQARQHSIALIGRPAGECFDPVPESDLLKVFAATLKQWNSPTDWAGDERNVVLALARIWYSAATGKIVPKDVAVDWALPRLPVEFQPVLREARQAYLGCGEDRLAERGDELIGFVRHVKREATRLLDARTLAASTAKNEAPMMAPTEVCTTSAR
jgi:streptomycin 3"-adenylyltransferase